MTAAPADPPALEGLTTNQDLDPDRLRQAFGVFPTGVVALAAEIDGVPLGLAASSFTSVSLDPPLVSVSVARTSKTWPDLRGARHFGVTVLADHHGAVCRQLSGPVDDRFRGYGIPMPAPNRKQSSRNGRSVTPAMGATIRGVSSVWGPICITRLPSA